MVLANESSNRRRMTFLGRQCAVWWFAARPGKVALRWPRPRLPRWIIKTDPRPLEMVYAKPIRPLRHAVNGIINAP